MTPKTSVNERTKASLALLYSISRELTAQLDLRKGWNALVLKSNHVTWLWQHRIDLIPVGDDTLDDLRFSTHSPKGMRCGAQGVGCGGLLFKEGLRADRICFSGGRTTAAMMKHGGSAGGTAPEPDIRTGSERRPRRAALRCQRAGIASALLLP